MTRAFLGLGSNLGDRLANLQAALEALRELLSVTAVSDVFESEPVGGPEGQDNYYNAVVEVDTGLDPHGLLDICRTVEELAGRVRTVRWAPRILDADVLLVGDATVSTDELVVPHPRMWERAFVVEPLAQLDPDVVAAHRPTRPVLAGRAWRVGTLE